MNMKLRVHVKTHKCIPLGDIQTLGEKCCLCASTLKEAEYFADAGYEDILVTAIFTEDKIPRMKVLAEKLEEFHVMVDHNYGIDLLEQNPLQNKQWSVFLKLDCGFKRAGTEWDNPATIELAKKINASKMMTIHGLYTFDGNAYANRCSEETTDRTLHVYNKLKSEDITCKVLSIGCTPTGCAPAEKVKLATEMHMGNYVFLDCQQWKSVGLCKEEDIAAKVMTRVKGHYPNKGTMLVDCGFTALSLDGRGKLEHGAMAVVQDHPELVFYNMNQEVGYIRAREGETLDYSRYPLGAVLYLYPYHSCATAMQFRDYVIHEDGKVKDVWTTCNQEW